MLFIRAAWKSWVLAVCLFAALPSFSQTRTTLALGSVQGAVLDGDGRPLSDAYVHGLPEHGTKEIWTTSDTAGNFSFTGLPPGGIYLRAFKESDGYPDNFYAFFVTSVGQSIKVNVEAGKTTEGAIIRLGPKAAYLSVDITDESGAPLGASLMFTRDDIRAPFGTGSRRGKEPILVPPVPFRLTVEAQGYEPWHYGGKDWQGKAGLITLKSGETLNLSVRLRRSR